MIFLKHLKIIWKSSLIIKKPTYYQKFHTSIYNRFIEDDDDLFVRDLAFPYFRDSMRADMWKKHKSDPEIWNIEKLSQHFGTTVERTKAILFLMRKREELMAKEGLLNPSEDLLLIWKKYYNDPINNTISELAKAHYMPEQEIEQFILKMQNHTSRIEHVIEQKKQTEELLEEYEEDGFDISFRETYPDQKHEELSQRMQPVLFKDDELETAKRELLQRVARETKAKVNITVNHFLKPPSIVPVNPFDPIPPSSSKKKNSSTDDKKLSQFKIAFRDTSSYARINAIPTMIRTRSGR
jgi:hypothetical protein